jgi:hypothetical protein
MKQIPGYPDYFVTKDGRIFSNTLAGFQWKTGNRKLRELKPATNNKGYLYLTIHNKSGSKSALVHRLVLMTFVPQPAGKPCACHINGKCTENRLDNLYWGSHSDNMQDRRKHGTANWGERNGRAKYTAEKMLEIDRLLKSGLRQFEVAKIVGVDSETVARIKYRRNWKHLFEPTIKTLERAI